MLFKTVLSKKIKKGTGGNVNDEPSPIETKAAETAVETAASEEEAPEEATKDPGDFEEEVRDDFKELMEENAEIVQAESEEGGQK